VSLAAITLCVASQQVIPKVSVYFVIESFRKLLDTPSYCFTIYLKEQILNNLNKISPEYSHYNKYRMKLTVPLQVTRNLSWTEKWLKKWKTAITPGSRIRTGYLPIMKGLFK
jgi:hypothetical protein